MKLRDAFPAALSDIPESALEAAAP